MSFKKTKGYNGITHDSKAEADASFVLAEHGIYQDGSYFPLTFQDKNGEAFRAKSDFKHEPTGIKFEFKTRLNGVTSQATSRSQLADSQSGDEAYKALKFGWNHSGTKQDLVQRGVAVAKGAMILIFPKEPDQETLKQLNKRRTFWLTIGSPGWKQLLGFLTLLKHGLTRSLTYVDDDGEPLHVLQSLRMQGA